MTIWSILERKLSKLGIQMTKVGQPLSIVDVTKVLLPEGGESTRVAKTVAHSLKVSLVTRGQK